jgi:hypothetical protein
MAQLCPWWKIGNIQGIFFTFFIKEAASCFVLFVAVSFGRSTAPELKLIFARNVKASGWTAGNWKNSCSVKPNMPATPMNSRCRDVKNINPTASTIMTMMMTMMSVDTSAKMTARTPLMRMAVNGGEGRG